MKDVAVAAGVSKAAVSYAYSRPHKLSAAQRANILRIAAELHYPGPSAIGSSLRTGKTGAIGILIMDSLGFAVSDPSTQALIEGIVSDRRLDDLALTLIPLAHRAYTDDPDEYASSDARRPAPRGLVDGAILHSMPDDHPAIRMMLRRGIPIVTVDAPQIEGVPTVRVDDRGAAATQVRYLLETGHREIGILADRLRPDGRRGAVDAARRAAAVERAASERLLGYADAFSAIGRDFETVPVYEAGGFDPADGREATDALLEQHDVTAIVATSDTLALACLAQARSRGLAVPEELSIVGFDDAPAAALAGLTTMHQPLVDKGRHAAHILLEMLAGHDDVESGVLPTELVVRTTTGPPRAGSA